MNPYQHARATDLQIDIDALAAATLSLPGGRTLTAGIEKELDGDNIWVEPFVGARLGAQLGDHWRVQVRGDIGGFGVDNSDFSWQAVALAGYEWRVNGWNITLFGGYRALGQDYSDGGFTWDTVVHGPVLGAQFTFYF
ncbi:MAG: hypothetical protein H6812_10145 [Phycisphaeraceae bacterium]|nr:hypothetical protein [Phycisphaerales bacterium]MCB9843606.1 hypothetical protein [Phycisphaeraceae bacterium]